MNRCAGVIVLSTLTAGCTPTLPLSANWYLTSEGELATEDKRLYLAVVNRGETKLSISRLRINVDSNDNAAGYTLKAITDADPLHLKPGEVYVVLLSSFENGNRTSESPVTPYWPKACVLPSNVEVKVHDMDRHYKYWSLGYRDVILLSLPAVLPNALPTKWAGECAWPLTGPGAK